MQWCASFSRPRRSPARGVTFLSPPEEVPWGVSAVFVDLYGTVHNLLEPGQG